MKLCGLTFRHEHIFDASKLHAVSFPTWSIAARLSTTATRSSDLISRYALTIDDALTPRQRDTDLLLRRMLDDLYWVMSYSRWEDDRF